MQNYFEELSFGEEMAKIASEKIVASIFSGYSLSPSLHNLTQHLLSQLVD